MTIQTINIGNLVNDGLGDDLRTAFQKVNANFANLAVTVVDAGTGSGESLFKQQVGSTLEFKTLTAGTRIFLDSTQDTIIINNTANAAFERFVTDAGDITAGVGNNSAIELKGAVAPGSTTGRKDIEVTAFGPRISFKTLIPVTDILTSYDFGPISSEFANTLQLALNAANIDFGILRFDESDNDAPSSNLQLDCGEIEI
jgi:hypothetical protein